MLSITKTFTFEAAHSISVHSGACSNIHGHSYQLQISISAWQLNEQGMLMDFKALKKLVESVVMEELDHSLMLMDNKVNRQMSKEIVGKVKWFPFEPTVELLILYIKEQLQPVLPADVYLRQLKLYETETAFAEWINTQPSTYCVDFGTAAYVKSQNPSGHVL